MVAMMNQRFTPSLVSTFYAVRIVRTSPRTTFRGRLVSWMKVSPCAAAAKDARPGPLCPNPSTLFSGTSSGWAGHTNDIEPKEVSSKAAAVRIHAEASQRAERRRLPNQGTGRAQAEALSSAAPEASKNMTGLRASS